MLKVSELNTTSKAKKKSGLLQAFKKHYALYLMVLPVLVYMILFNIYPLIQGFIMSLHQTRLLGDNYFVGLSNYIDVLGDMFFWQAMRNTVIIGGGILALGFVAPIIVAILLNEVIHTRFKKITQTIVYFPSLFSWVIIGGIWIFMLAPNGGLINEILLFLGREETHFLASLRYARGIMILSSVWRDMGYNSIIYLAAIAGISPTLYEAAKLDGASKWQEITKITIPQLYPTMKVVILLNMMGILRIFDQVFMMRNPSIARNVNVLMIYTFERGILQMDLGTATAASFLVIIATFVLVLVSRKLTRYDKED